MISTYLRDVALAAEIGRNRKCMLVSCPIQERKIFPSLPKKFRDFIFISVDYQRERTRIDSAPHHTPEFFIDDSGLKTGLNVLANLVLDYMEKNKK